MSEHAAAAQTLTLTWSAIHADVYRLIQRLPRRDWTGIIAIPRGGLVPAAILGRALDIRLIDTLCIASYDDRTQGEARLLKGVPGDGTGWLMVDDLVDTGRTAQLARQLLPKAYFATIYAKPRGQGLAESFAAEIDQDTWIVFPWDLDA